LLRWHKPKRKQPKPKQTVNKQGAKLQDKQKLKHRPKQQHRLRQTVNKREGKQQDRLNRKLKQTPLLHKLRQTESKQVERLQDKQKQNQEVVVTVAVGVGFLAQVLPQEVLLAPLLELLMEERVEVGEVVMLVEAAEMPKAVTTIMDNLTTTPTLKAA
jgi:hypothetical protein